MLKQGSVTHVLAARLGNLNPVLLVVLLSIIILFIATREGHAQVENVEWMDPIRLNLYDETHGSWFGPIVVATTDRYGNVHIFWRESGDANVTVYARASCDEPPRVLDILPSSDVPMAALVDDQDYLHLSWTADGMNFQKKAVHLTEAFDARAWINAPIIYPPGAVTVGLDGTWYATSRTLGEVYLSFSTDQGQTWSDKRLIVSADNPNWFANSDLLLDHQGRLHVTWTSAIERGVPHGQRLYYRYSDDLGITWSDSQVLDVDDDRYQDGYAPWTQKLTMDSTGRLHLIWNGAPAGQRNYRYSDDRGLNWSEDIVIWPDLRGITGSNNLSEDSSGVLHMITGSLAWGLHHAYLYNGVWSQPMPIHPDIGDAEGHISFITRGNRLHAIWANVIETHDIWYSCAVVNAPEVEVPPFPTSAPRLQAMSVPNTPSLTPVPTSMPQATLQYSDLGTPPLSTGALSTSTILIGSSLLVLLVIGSVVVAKTRFPSRS